MAEGLAISMQHSLIEKLLVDLLVNKIYYCVYKRPPLEHMRASWIQAALLNNYLKSILIAIFMDAIRLCSSTNKLHLFSLTQNNFILIQTVNFTSICV